MNYALCIDPGFNNVGIAVVAYDNNKIQGVLEVLTILQDKSVESNGSIYQSSKNIIQSAYVYNLLEHFILAHHVSTVCMESLSYSPNAASNAKISMVLGTVTALAVRYRLTILEAPPQYLKKLVYGDKKLDRKESKAEIERCVRDRFGTKLLKLLTESGTIASKQCHIFDALSAAYLIEDANCQRYTLGDFGVENVRVRKEKARKTRSNA